MAKETVIAMSDSSESSTGSNGDHHSATAPSVGAHDFECTSAAPAPPTTLNPSTNQPTPTSNKQNARRVTTPLSPLLPPIRLNKTTATALPPPSPQESNKIITLVRISSRPPPSTVLSINSNTIGSGVRQQLFVGVTTSRLNGRRSGVHHIGGAIFSPAFIAGDNSYSSKRTVDFLSQMAAGSSAPREVPRENPPQETLVEWAATLRLGNGRSQPVDLNLKLN